MAEKNFLEGPVSVSARSAEITGLLKAWGAGDHTALDRLTPLIYEDFAVMHAGTWVLIVPQ
jgi:hypothetical protein